MVARVARRAATWLTEPVPLGRVAAFRTLVYLFVIGDLLLFTPWVRTHRDLPGRLYHPLLVGRVLPLPTPTEAVVDVVFWALLAVAAAAATGRAPRLLGSTVLVLYFEWMVVAMSYGKVDHDRFAFLVALAVLPTAGTARHGDPTPTRPGGWALRVTQLAVVSTYFLAFWAKMRYAGPDWATGSVLARAVLRRGTDAARAIAPIPGVLVASQVAILAFELLSPVVFVLGKRARYLTVGFFYLFHWMTFAAITISFLPHQVAMASFLPIDRVRPLVWLRISRDAYLRRRRGSTTPAAGVSRVTPAD